MSHPAKPRPLSPHLQIYRPQLTTGLSILHRATGVALCFGLLVLVWWIVTLAQGPEHYVRFVHCATSLPGQIVLAGLSFSFFYHFCTGIRHLLWDAGYFLSIDGVYSTGRIAVAVAVLLTAGFWLKAYGMMP